MLATLAVTTAATSAILLEDLHTDQETTIFADASWLYHNHNPKTKLKKWIYDYRWWCARTRLRLRFSKILWVFIGWI